MKRLLLMICLITAPAFGATASNNAGPVVPLPPFRVDDYSTNLGFKWSARLKDDKISSVKFSTVQPYSIAGRAGLQLDDLLLSIDGHPVAGLTIEELQHLFSRDWKPGDTLTWQLTIERGSVFARQHTVALTLKAKPLDTATDTTKPSQ